MMLYYWLAYAENLTSFSCYAACILGVFIVCLIGLRMKNEIDLDDWIGTMRWVAPAFLLFLLLTLLPSVEHTREVEAKLTVKETKGEVSETVYYPSSECNSVRLCR